MSIDSTSSSKAKVYRKKTLKNFLSQSDRFPYSTMDQSKQSRTTSISERNSGDTLTDLSSLPSMSSKRNRRFSELKPPIIQQNQSTNVDRRNSIPQIHFGSILPNAFRSVKHQYKTGNKDDFSTSIDTSTNSSLHLYLNDPMATKFEQPSASKILNGSISGSRSNLSISSEVSSAMSHDESIPSTFILDISQSEPRSAEMCMLTLNIPLSVAEIYRQHFYDYFHVNYCADFQQEGPSIISLRYIDDKSDNNNNNCQARALIRIPSRNYDISMLIDRTNDEHILQLLCKQALLSTIQTCKSTSDIRANEKIYSFDRSNDEKQNCKIGLIYQRTDQTDEIDLFNNDIMSDEMIDFLQLLSDRVRLKGFENYRGDLDIKNDLHGEYSYYTQYHNREIMFNIAPMIPSSNINGQCVKRKGLVSNSFVCIVFQEIDAVFMPDFISGKVTQIYITVQPMKINEKFYYKVGIWHRPDLTGIIDPPGGIYERDRSFRDYFLTLLLNSIHLAIESPSLRFCIVEQRQRLKQEEIKKLSLNLCTSPIVEIVSDVNNNNTSYIERTISRDENLPRSPAPLVNDAIVPNPGRVSPIPTKKRTLSKIFSVFTRSSSISMSSNNDPPPPPPTPAVAASELHTQTTRTASMPIKEPVRRVASVKHRPAPLPPGASSRAPVAYKFNTTPAQSSTTPSASYVSNSFLSNNDKISTHNSFINTSPTNESGRNRSNSSPDDHSNGTTKRPLSNVSSASRDVSDTSSSFYASSDDEYSDDDEDELIRHRPTLTEVPILSSSKDTNL